MNVDSAERLPIKRWLDDVEETAMGQARNLANLPFAFKHIALMPDCHMGYGMPIGGVLATQGVIIPNAVGVDIGCGMCAVRTSLESIGRDYLAAIVDEIKGFVPVGFRSHNEPCNIMNMPQVERDVVWKSLLIVSRDHDKARTQLGTLGGGNHFIEIQHGSDGRVWVMIHSGSRNLGKQVADYYNKLAVKLNEEWCSSVPKKWELAFLPLDTPEAKMYLAEMEYCVQFALANRREMMNAVQVAFRVQVPGAQFEPQINIEHNYAAMEHHFGQNVMVHRKGATRARQGETGIIPGSQGTKSYIVRGLGNPQSFQSCSHGAGRRMGRKQAIRELDLAAEQAMLDGQGIIHSVTTAKDLDEAPGAYKDIEAVMADQADLVEVVVELSPLAVIKA